jgi:hypothetical protein
MRLLSTSRGLELTSFDESARNLPPGFIRHSCSGSGVKETSYYGTLANLFNEVGKTLKPRVRCIINIANKGAGLPDGGFFTPDQFQKRAKGELIEGQLPSRRCIEVKSRQGRVALAMWSFFTSYDQALCRSMCFLYIADSRYFLDW